MGRVSRLAAVVGIVGLFGAGCASGPGDVRVGDCFEYGSAAAFDWESEVSCGDPHSVEVFATVTVTGDLARYSRAELAQQDSPARSLYLSAVTRLCEPAWSEYTGYDVLAAQTPDAIVLPALYGDMAVEAMPAQQWDGGDKRLVCYQVFGRPGDGGEQAIMVEGRVLAGLATEPDEVPLDVRDCALNPNAERGEQKVACRQLHDREYLGHLDLAQFVGSAPGLDQAFLDRFESGTAPEADWNVIDEVCARVFPPLIGATRSDITILSQVFTADPDWGWAENGSYHVACIAQTAVPTSRSVIDIESAPLRG